ncbi:hypothetical protein AEYBE204_07685 [Asticcacaulis sp. YBE204]|nr:hypothetical protein AEYBE204_07685 [Asticcacaulis sp. YBE204]
MVFIIMIRDKVGLEFLQAALFFTYENKTPALYAVAPNMRLWCEIRQGSRRIASKVLRLNEKEGRAIGA